MEPKKLFEYGVFLVGLAGVVAASHWAGGTAPAATGTPTPVTTSAAADVSAGGLLLLHRLRRLL